MSDSGPMESIAIIGMDGRFPGANDLEKFWENLKNGVESINRFTDEELSQKGVPAEVIEDPDYVKAGTLLENIELFDAKFFGYNPNEAKMTDPQHRWFLESAWKVFEDAGYNPETYPGPVGVFAGSSTNDYGSHSPSQGHNTVVEDYQKMIGGDKDYLTTRVSYKLNLKGPSFTLQTACSTSLVAVALACQNLLTYQCDMALAGGVSITLPQNTGYYYQDGMILSPDGHCRAFDKNGKGIVPGRGVGLVLLKRLSEALEDEDHIYAVIKGSAINNDGSLKVGFTAPSVDGQAEVIATAQSFAEIDPTTISYVEAHGTGTPLGDPIEIAALTQVFGPSDKTYCAIGSVKSNIGHLDAAAGVAGLIKATLALKHQQIPPSLNFETPNPEIQWEGSPFFVNSELVDWKEKDHPRRAGVSSFGIGGTNAHIVLEEAPPRAITSESKRPAHLFLLSAKSLRSLDMQTDQLAHYFQKSPAPLGDIAYTLQNCRKHFETRRFFIGENLSHTLESLSHKTAIKTSDAGAINRKIVFMFSGQGSQYANMAKGLYDHEPVFKQALDLCAELAKNHLDLDIRDLLFVPEDQLEQASEQLKQTSITQPALFIVEYSLAQLWFHYGIKPEVMVGHSIGEYVAACLAEVLTLEDAIKLVCLRGRLMQNLPRGSMLAVPLPETELAPQLDENLSIAVLNGPNGCVVSGEDQHITNLHHNLATKDIDSTILKTSHAFHSVMMDPILDEFTEAVQSIPLNTPKIPFYSNVTGELITQEDACNPKYWARHLRHTVRFVDCVTNIAQGEPKVFLEVGPGKALTTFVKQNPSLSKDHWVLATTRHPKDNSHDYNFFLQAMGDLWLSGMDVEWAKMYQDEHRLKVQLPTYCFDGKKYWVGPAADRYLTATTTAIAAEPSLKLPDTNDWFYEPHWTVDSSQPTINSPETQGAWLIFADEMGVGKAVVEKCRDHGISAILVNRGSSFKSNGGFEIDPNQEVHYHQLFAELRQTHPNLKKIVHLCCLDDHSGYPSLESISFEASQGKGFYSILEISKALANHGFLDQINIEVVTNHLHAINDTEVPHAEKSTIIAACKVVPLEYTNIACRSIDFGNISDDNHREFMGQLWSELINENSEVLVAYRGPERFKYGYKKVPKESASWSQRKIKENGAYVITGGLGGMGLVFAEHLSKLGHTKLLLLGRSAFPDAHQWDDYLANHDPEDPVSIKIRKLKTMQEQGAQLMIRSADVADLEQMTPVIAEAIETFGGINGVIHTAGVIDFAGVIHNRTRKMTEDITDAKLKGTLILEQLLEDQPLDFFVLCSSIGTVLYHVKFAQVGYVAANEFLDAFAYQRNRIKRGNMIAINWDDWQEVGMSVVAANNLAKKLGESDAIRFLNDGVLPDEGYQVLQRAINSDLSRLVISTHDLETRLQQDKEQNNMGLEETTSSQEANYARPSLNNDYLKPEGEIETGLAGIWQELLGIDLIGRKDDFFDLGGDSLIALRMFRSIEKKFGVLIPITTLFENPTIQDIGSIVSNSSQKEEKPKIRKIQRVSREQRGG